LGGLPCRSDAQENRLGAAWTLRNIIILVWCVVTLVQCGGGSVAGSGGAPVLVGSTDASARYSPDTCQDWPSGATTLVLARVPI